MDLQLGTRMQAGKGIRRRRPSVRQHNWKYELCQNKAPCEYGSRCTYAHSEEELHHWLKSRVEEEPRQRPSKGARAPYRMCKNVLENEYCLNDVQCNFPHSTEELKAWTSIFQELQGSVVAFRPRPKIHPTAHYSICNEKAPCPNGADCLCAHSEEELHHWFQSRVEEEPRLRPTKVARCQMCKYVEETGYCSFEMHCRFPHSKKEQEAWTRIIQEESKEVRIRQRPIINPLVDYEMCENKPPCPHGLECNFAHSEEELRHWFRSRVEEEPRKEHPAGVAPVYKMCRNVEEHGYCSFDTRCHYPHSKKELDAWKKVARRPQATVGDFLPRGPHEGKKSSSLASGTKRRTQSQPTQVVLQSQLSKEWPKLSGHQPELQRKSNSTEASEWQLAYQESLDKHGSVEMNVKRCIFAGTPAVGKSSLKHLLVHNTPKAVKTSTAVMETPEVVTEQYAVGEFTSAWQLVTDDVMEKSLHECIMGKEYDDVDKYPELPQPMEEKTAEASKMAIASEVSHAVECTSHALKPTSVKNEVVALLEQYRPILPESTLEAQYVKLQRASFIHLLDTGGQPSFQDALPLLLDAPCTYIQVFNAARDLDQPVPITYRPSDKEEVAEDEQFSAETAWEMMLRSFSSMQTMAHKCSEKMPIFQQKGSHLPKLRIFVVGNFRDQLFRAGKEVKVGEDICRRFEKLEGKPYYDSIQINSAGQPFYLINSMAEDEDEKANVNSLRKDISKAEFSLRLKMPVMWFLCLQTTRHCPQKFLRFQDLLHFCIESGFVDEENAQKQYSALLHLFSLLGFYSFFNLQGVPNEGNFICTDTGMFLKEVSKLLAIQHRKNPRCSGMKKFKRYGLISSSDDELFEELGIRKEVDRRWFLGALEHLGLLARYAGSRQSAQSYFMPIALPQERTKVAGQGTVASLCVTFEFPSPTPPLVDTDLPRGVFCQLAVKLSKGPWKPDPKASNRTTVKFTSGNFDLYLREAPGFISLTPILIEKDGKEPIAELHEFCTNVFRIFSVGMKSAAEDVLGVNAPNFVYGFECRCSCTQTFECHCSCAQTPHLATLRQGTSKGESLTCQATEEKRDSKQEELIWFSPVDTKLVKDAEHGIWIMEEPNRFATVNAHVGRETDDHEYKALALAVDKNKKSQMRPCEQKEDVFEAVKLHKKEIAAMLNHPGGGTVHFGIRDEGKIVEEGLGMDQDDAMEYLVTGVGQILDSFYPSVETSFCSVEPVKLLYRNGKQTGRWRFDICVKPYTDAVVWIDRNSTKAYYRQGGCSKPMRPEMLVNRIKAALTRNVDASPADVH